MNKYYENPGISQSYLKRFRNPNPRSLHRSPLDEDYYYVRESIHFSKGKLLDVLLEGGDPNDYFYIEAPDYKRPSEIVESIAQQVVDENCYNDVNRIIDIIRKHNFQPRWKLDTISKWIDDKLDPVIKYKESHFGKTVITHEEYVQIATMATSILEGEYTKPILDEYEGEFQVEVYYEDMKGLIDYLQIDHKKKVFRVIDFKSTGDYLEIFKKSIKGFGYDYQLSFYSYLVGCKYLDYKMLDPVLLVASTKEPEYAEPFTLGETVIKNARYGWVDKLGRVHKGWEELLSIARNYNQELYNKELITTGTNYINEL